jgi:hypothetical protein
MHDSSESTPRGGARPVARCRARRTTYYYYKAHWCRMAYRVRSPGQESLAAPLVYTSGLRFSHFTPAYMAPLWLLLLAARKIRPFFTDPSHRSALVLGIPSQRGGHLPSDASASNWHSAQLTQTDGVPGM